MVRLRLHVSEDRFRGRETLYPLAHPNASRTYIHAKPYVLEPEIVLGIDLFPAPVLDGAVGTVRSASWEGMRHRVVGNAQAWHYPADRLLVFWECFLEDRVRHADPLRDPLLATVWTGFERLLRDRFPATERIATPSWEDFYERPAWQQFLGDQGFLPFSPGCFVKNLTASTGSRQASGG